jgi:hypothetical protein
MNQAPKLSKQSGSVLLETVLVMVVLAPLMSSIFEICLMTYAYTTLNDAAREGVHYAMSHGSGSSNCSGPSAGCADPTAANVTAVVVQQSKLSMKDMTHLSVSVSYPDGNSNPSSRVQVSLSYPYSPFVFYPEFSQTVNLSSEGRIIF